MPRATPKPNPVHDCHCGDHAWTATTKGYITLVSPEDRHHIEARAYHALVHPSIGKVYARCSKSRKNFRLHRQVLGDALTDDDHVDHANGNGLDNRRVCTLTGRVQLRPATAQQNCFNSRPQRGTAIPGVKGVSFTGKGGRPYRARIMHAGRRVHIGTFHTIKEAADAYDAAARRFFGAFACLNNYEEPAHAIAAE